MVARLQRTLRGRNAILNIFELWVGLAGIIAGVIFFYDPASIDHNSLSQVIGHGLTSVWVVAYMLSGIAIWVGLLWPSPRFEVAGLWLLGAATAMNGIAIADIFGLRGAATAATLITLTAAAWTRAVLVQQVALRLVSDHHARS
jgi:hypothetical protein